jgi:hypothetical protein
MKKIDTWLDIQRFVQEADVVVPTALTTEIEIFGRFRKKRTRSRRRTLLTTLINNRIRI